MYVYIKSEPDLWTVGHYPPGSESFIPESDHGNIDSAAARVCELNGGNAVKQVPRGENDPIGLRDLFAAHALAGFIASHTGECTSPEPNWAAQKAYQYAEAMILARKEVGPDAE